MLIRNDWELVVAFAIVACFTAAGCIGWGIANLYAVGAVATVTALVLVAAVLMVQRREGVSGDANFFDRPPAQMIVVLTDPAKLAETLEALRAGGWTPATVTI